MLKDATCYESYMRYPTNGKLLWESVDWIQSQMKRVRKGLKIPTPRTKHLEQKDKYFTYMRKRKKPWKQTTKRPRSLLYLLDKLIRELDKIGDKHRSYLRFPEKYYEKRRVIRKVLEQQQEMFTTGSYSVPVRTAIKA